MPASKSIHRKPFSTRNQWPPISCANQSCRAANQAFEGGWFNHLSRLLGSRPPTFWRSPVLVRCDYFYLRAGLAFPIVFVQQRIAFHAAGQRNRDGLACKTLRGESAAYALFRHPRGSTHNESACGDSCAIFATQCNVYALVCGIARIIFLWDLI